MSDVKFKELLNFLVVASAIGLLAFGILTPGEIVALSPALVSYFK